MIRLRNKIIKTPDSPIKYEKNSKPKFAGWINQKFRIAWVISPHRSDKIERNRK